MTGVKFYSIIDITVIVTDIIIKKLNFKKENSIMKKFVCQICGYVHEGDSAPDQCPICKAPQDKFMDL